MKSQRGVLVMNYKNIEIKMDRLGGKNINIGMDSHNTINPLGIRTIHADVNYETESICNKLMCILELHFEVILNSHERNVIREIVTGNIDRSINQDVEVLYNGLLQKEEEGDTKLKWLISAVKTLI
jgi:type IV secretory pathway VirB4 component